LKNDGRTSRSDLFEPFFYRRLEVVLSEDEPAENDIETAHQLLLTLGISPEQLVEEAYVDLLRQAG
jgi:adenylate cyclase class IV